MKKLNKKKILIIGVILLAVIILTIFLILMLGVNVKTQLFDLTENEPLKQTYARSQTHFKNDIMPGAGISEEEYQDFLDNPDDYVVYSLRCQVENKSNKTIKATYTLNENDMWIDTTTMANSNNEISPNSKINKNISILVKLDGKSKEDIKQRIEKNEITVHIFNTQNEQKELKKVNAKFES